jgi:hypothetical protein
MQVIEKRSDGTLLCVLSRNEARMIGRQSTAKRKWAVRGFTHLHGRRDLESRFEHVVHAESREDAEREGARIALDKRGFDAVLSDIGAKDVTGMTRGIFGWR